ncbi:MAG: ATP-binding protein [Candidatus Thiodiazotropha sp.]
MKLRTKIVILLFLFGFAPLTAIVVSNLSFVIDRMEFFYHKAYLQNLRADFRDLDEHLASRNEMLRLLAKLPEPGLILGQEEEEKDHKQIDQARVRYTEWINQILRDHQDIIQILFLDLQGKPRYWLELNSHTHQWEPTIKKPDMPSKDFFKRSVNQKFGRVAASKINLNSSATLLDPHRFMTLRMISPILSSDKSKQITTIGAVVINIDVGGMANAYRNTLWVTNDGTYLADRLGKKFPGQAFKDFKDLQSLFEEGKLALWEGRGRQVIWVPMFTTESSGPLWVGRPVDPSPMNSFRNVLISRVTTIVLVVLITLLMVARWIALRTEQFGERLRDGVERVLREDSAVRFDWHGSSEIKELGKQLTELAETHYQQAKQQRHHADQLEESNRYKSEFLANVSHELRTPLNSILLLSKLLSETSTQFSSEQQKQLQVIHEAGCDLRALIDNILDLSRIEAGKTNFTLQKVSLRVLLSELVDLVKPQFDAKHLYLKLEIDDSLPDTFLSDQEKVRQILKNFLSNALKFTHQGGAILRAYSHPTSQQQPICFAVEDSGIGIAPNKQQLVFEAFKQADGSTRRQFGGTGLGLSISRELSHLLGGTIMLESSEGEGATFTLCLPCEFDYQELPASQIEIECYEEPELLREVTNIPQSESVQQTPPFKGLRVLIVDDDLQNLLALTPLLEAWGFEVIAAGDGQEAIDTLNDDHDFCLVLMDIMMPEVDGYDTIKHIREKMAFEELSIIVLSAKNTVQDRTLSLDAGADDFIAKPVDPEQLLALINSQISGLLSH